MSSLQASTLELLMPWSTALPEADGAVSLQDSILLLHLPLFVVEVAGAICSTAWATVAMPTFGVTAQLPSLEVTLGLPVQCVSVTISRKQSSVCKG